MKEKDTAADKSDDDLKSTVDVKRKRENFKQTTTPFIRNQVLRCLEHGGESTYRLLWKYLMNIYIHFTYIAKHKFCI